MMRLAIDQIAAIVRKDIILELRTREAITAMLVFAVMAIVMFNFALRLRVDTFRPVSYTHLTLPTTERV